MATVCLILMINPLFNVITLQLQLELFCCHLKITDHQLEFVCVCGVSACVCYHSSSVNYVEKKGSLNCIELKYSQQRYKTCCLNHN